MKGRRHDRLGRIRKKRGIVRIVTARSMPLWISYRIPRRNALQHPNKQQQSSSLFYRWTYHDHFSFSPRIFFFYLSHCWPTWSPTYICFQLKERNWIDLKKKSQDLFEYTKKNPCVDRRLKAREEFFQLEAVLASRYPFSSSVWIFSSLMRCRWKLGIEHFKFQMLFEIQTENYVL